MQVFNSSRQDWARAAVAVAALTLGSIGALGATPVSTSAGAGEQAGGQADGDDVGIGGPCNPNLPLRQEAACDPAEDLPDTDALMTQIKDYAGARFAGSWIDRSNPAAPVMKIGLTDRSEADQRFADSVTGNDRVIVVPARFTQAELESVSDSITADLKDQQYPFMVGPDVSAGIVTVQLPAARVEAVTSRLAAVLAAAPASNVRNALAKVNHDHADVSTLVNVSGGFDGLTNTDTRETYPKHTGGRYLVLDQISGDRVANCTSAFTIISDNGASMGLTAGHCATGYLATTSPSARTT